MAQIIQQSLAEIGIKVTIKSMDDSSRTAALDSANFDMAFTYFTTDINDPSQTGRRADGRKEVSTATYSRWVDPKVGPLLDQAKLTLGEKDRAKLYSQVQRIVNDQVPFITLFYSPVAYAYTSKLQDFKATPMGNYTLATSWLKK